jgi:FkbM family methyltransferase
MDSPPEEKPSADKDLAPSPFSVADDRATEEDIYYCYRLILKREPDPGGLAHYRRRVANGFSLGQLTDSFLTSEEYRLRRHRESLPTAVDLGGYHVYVDKSDSDFGQAIFHSRAYEEHVRQAVRENLREGAVALDVGANVGVITFLAASIVGKAGRVIALEPNPDNLQLLYRGIVLNGFTNVHVLPYAASNRSALFSLAGGASNTHLVGPADEAGCFAQSVVLDQALEDLPKLNFVKMDIEGHEPEALDGLRRTIARDRPTLLLEFNPRCLGLQRQNPRAFLNQIFALYPRVRIISGFNDDAVFEHAHRLMAYWERRNREITAQNLLPDGMLHFDLITKP